MCPPPRSSSQALLDLGGSVHLTPEQFLAAAKDCLNVMVGQDRGELGVDVMVALNSVSTFLTNNAVRGWRHCSCCAYN